MFSQKTNPDILNNLNKFFKFFKSFLFIYFHKNKQSYLIFHEKMSLMLIRGYIHEYLLDGIRNFKNVKLQGA